MTYKKPYISNEHITYGRMFLKCTYIHATLYSIFTGILFYIILNYYN